jgi:glycosyltransferase 2 family protein
VSASNKALLTVLKYVLSIAGGGLLLWLSIRGVNFDELRTGFREADYLWVGLGLVVALLSHWLRAARWVILFRAAGYESNTMNLFASVMVGNMVNQALPRAGEISRATVTARSEKIPLSVTFGTMVTDRIFDVIALGLLVLAVLAMQYKEILRIMDKAFSTPPDPNAVVEPGMPLWQIIALAIMGLGLLVFLVFRKRILSSHLYARIKRFTKETWEAVLSVRKMDQPWLFILHTIGIWACYILMTYLVFFSLSASSDLPVIFALTAFVMGGIGMVFPSPGGIGSYHFAIIMSFVAYGPSFGWTEQMARTVGTNLAFIIHTSQMIMMILVGLVCYLYLLWQIRLGNEETPSEP